MASNTPGTLAHVSDPAIEAARGFVDHSLDAMRRAIAGTCRRCARCGGHSANVRAALFLCENCSLEF